MTSLPCDVCGHSRNRHNLWLGLYGWCRVRECVCRGWEYRGLRDRPGSPTVPTAPPVLSKFNTVGNGSSQEPLW